MAKLHDRFVLFYPMRIVGAYFLVLLIVLHVRSYERWSAYSAALVAILLALPHVVFVLTRRRAHDRARIESIAFLVDAFFLGVVVHLNSFSLLPSLILVTVALVNGLAVGGFKRMLFSGLSLAAGIAAPMLVFGPNFEPRNAFGVNLASSVFLFVYFMFFAYSAFNRSALLVRSQNELREQKATLEIEKMRSDRLLLNLVPAGLAGELDREGRIAPRAFDPVTLIAVSLRGFSRAVEEHDPADALALLTHCFQAFDAIAARHGLEKLKTMGNLYLAIAGLPRPAAEAAAPSDARAAVEAALEMRDFLIEVAHERGASGAWAPEPRLAVHSGKVIGAVVETAKLAFDVWGTVVPELLRLHQDAACGQVLASEATRRLAGDGYAWLAAGPREGVAAWRVERPADVPEARARA